MKTIQEVQERLAQINIVLEGSYSAMNGEEGDKAIRFVINKLEVEKDTLDWVLKA